MNLRSLAVVALLLSLGAAGLFAFRWQAAESRLREHRQWTHFLMDSLGKSVRFPPPPDGSEGRDSIYWQWVATTAELQSRGWQKALRYWVENRATLLSPFELEDLRREGLTDPAGQLRDSLAAHPELIPYDAVLGGTMLFSPGEGVVLLGRPYVFADFGDGHIGGKMLVEYSVAPGPRIIWKLLWAQGER